MVKSEIIRLLKKPALWTAIIICSASVWLIGFFWASQTPLKYTFRVWVGFGGGLEEGLGDEIADICGKYGMKKCALNAYNPEDFYYPAAFALQSNNVDIYLLNKSEAESAAQTGIFIPLEGEFKDALVYGGETIGAGAGEGRYVMINRASNKDVSLLYEVVNAIASRGAV